MAKTKTPKTPATDAWDAHPANEAGKRLYAIARFLRDTHGMDDEAKDLTRIARMFFPTAKRPTTAEYDALYRPMTLADLLNRRNARRDA